MWMSKAAEQSDAEAQFVLAGWLRSGAPGGVDATVGTTVGGAAKGAEGAGGVAGVRADPRRARKLYKVCVELVGPAWAPG